MADLETSPPPWLQRNWSPTQSFDPTPWLQERYNRQIQQQTLPLQLQGMALKNQAQQLAIEHQGMENDITNLQLQQRKEQFPQVSEWLKTVATKPLQEQLNDPGPPVTDPQLQQTITNYKDRVANTLIAQGAHQKLLGQKIEVADIIKLGGKPPAVGQDGFYDEGALADAKTAALQAQSARNIAEKTAETTATEKAKLEFERATLPDQIKILQAKAQAQAEAKSKYELDPKMKVASDLADLQSQLRQSEQATMRMKDTPEMLGEIEKQKKLRDTISNLEKQIGGHDSVLEVKDRMVEAANKEVEDAKANNAPPAEIAAKVAERDRLEALAYPKGTQIKGVNPVTGAPEVRIAGGTTAEQDAVTAKVRSELQEQINGSVQAAKSLHDLEQNVTWKTVGPFAWAAEKFGRYGPGTMLGVTGAMGAKGRAEIRNEKIDVMRELELRGRTSPTIMKAIAEGLPSLGIFENPATARIAVEERKRSIIVDGLNSAKQLGVRPPGELISLLSTFPSSEIRNMANKGTISPQDATEAFTLQTQKKNAPPSKTPLADWVR